MSNKDFKETERVDGHIWGRYKSDKYESCKVCMMIRRRDKKNSPCKGKAKLRL
jgi:hypothetical protein